MPVQPPRPRLPSLNALRTFEAAARLGHFARAAEELGVTPSAAAQQIRQLEAWLGAGLFHRQAQGVVLTAAAREALPVLAEGFDRLAEAVQRLRASLGPPSLSVAALPSIAQFWLSPRLRRAFPGLQVSLAAEERPPRFRRDLYDLGVFYLARPPPASPQRWPRTRWCRSARRACWRAAPGRRRSLARRCCMTQPGATTGQPGCAMPAPAGSTLRAAPSFPSTASRWQRRSPARVC